MKTLVPLRGLVSTHMSPMYGPTGRMLGSVRGAPTPQVVTRAEREAAKAKRSAQRAARKRSRK